MTRVSKVDPNDQQIYGSSYIEAYRKKEGEGRLERLLEYINPQPTDNILDIGCGSGFIYDLLQDKIKTYVGIDENRAFIEDNLKRFGDNTKSRTFTRISLRKFLEKHKTAKYQKIFLLDVTEHLVDSELKETLDLCYGALDRGGWLMIHTPNARYFMEIFKSRGLLKQTLGHVGVRNHAQYRKMLNDAGFESNKCKVQFLNHYVPVMKHFHTLSHIPFLGKYFEARLFISCQR